MPVSLEHISESFKSNYHGFLGTGLSWLGVVAANAVQLEYWLRVCSLSGAIVASTVTVWGVFRRDGRESRDTELEAKVGE